MRGVPCYYVGMQQEIYKILQRHGLFPTDVLLSEITPEAMRSIERLENQLLKLFELTEPKTENEDVLSPYLKIIDNLKKERQRLVDEVAANAQTRADNEFMLLCINRLLSGESLSKIQATKVMSMSNVTTRKYACKAK